MAVRCPDAKIAGMAALKDWKLVFKMHADIIPCEGCVVPVLVWEISEKDERNLDRYEGFPSYYVKKLLDVTVTDLNGAPHETVNAMAYVMTEGHKLSTPSRSYYDVLAEGYDRFGFDCKILEDAMKEASENELS